MGGAVAKFQVQQEARAGWLRATVRVIWHMLLGHREASRAIREAAAPEIAGSSERDSGERDSGAAGAAGARGGADGGSLTLPYP